ncbi:phosphoglycerate dehydrogenase [Anaeromyxobacter oryzae]|uniref:D-3-phosphoglycerate dehydrogenase n=1 Tax=Anaeromyxobacter oryzae TaxID=2918170 RepID=A0ABN6MZ00_9BACT|nr:phosphoglycerate dehydrogenase [Anaeromyxobacter oryzae]BDG06170.1 D-3-phosphoglycerate dehydrogenase [Anaeromyxobacter oryzae]
MSARVLVSDDLSPEAVKVLEEAGLEVDVKVGLKPDALEAIIGGYDALAVRSATKVTAKLLERATRLKVIGRAGVGVDNVDLDAATRRGVVVMNTPGGSSVTVAELALAMILGLYRHVPAATASVKAGKWEKKKFQGHELSGKTLGVVGIGNIGSVLVDRAVAMKMRVIAYDPFISPEAAAKLGVTLVELDQLWAEADAISLHVPLTEQTRNLVNAGVLARMKRGALLVNCARGGIVDERALADALASGHLGGAALDVFEKEPPPPDHPLFAVESFVCTPHIGASTEEAQSAVAVAIAEQLAAYLQKGVVKNAVNVPGLPREVMDQLAPYLPLVEKLGSLAAQLAPAGPTEVTVEVAGELAAVPMRPLSARALVGLLRHFLETPLNDVNAPAIAKDRGMAVREVRSAESHDYASVVTVTVRGQGGEAQVAGTVYGKREARIVRVDGFRLEAVPEGHVIVCENDDAPGVFGNLGTALGDAGVNIARISLSRQEDRSRAFAFLNVDSAPGPEVLERLRRLPHVRVVRAIHL